MLLNNFLTSSLPNSYNHNLITKISFINYEICRYVSFFKSDY